MKNNIPTNVIDISMNLAPVDKKFMVDNKQYKLKANRKFAFLIWNADFYLVFIFIVIIMRSSNYVADIEEIPPMLALVVYAIVLILGIYLIRYKLRKINRRYALNNNFITII